MKTDLFERAEALGVDLKFDGRDLERLLEAVHQREGELMLLRHAIIRRLSQIPETEPEAR